MVPSPHSIGAALLALVMSLAASSALGQTRPIPQLVKKDGKFAFLVDGKPFIMLGGQVGNFSAYPDLMERAWPTFAAMSANTVEYPVYWNVIEPVEGQFDFAAFDTILRGARAHNLRVILLWFGTWKNGAMDWTPNWVKSDPARFPACWTTAAGRSASSRRFPRPTSMPTSGPTRR